MDNDIIKVSNGSLRLYYVNPYYPILFLPLGRNYFEQFSRESFYNHFYNDIMLRKI